MTTETTTRVELDLPPPTAAELAEWERQCADAEARFDGDLIANSRPFRRLIATARRLEEVRAFFAAHAGALRLGLIMSGDPLRFKQPEDSQTMKATKALGELLHSLGLDKETR